MWPSGRAPPRSRSLLSVVHARLDVHAPAQAYSPPGDATKRPEAYSTSQPGAQVSGWPHIPPPTYPQVLVGTRGLCASTRLVLYAPGFGSAASLSLQGISIQPTACDKVLSVGCALLVSATGVLWVCGLGGPQMASLSVSPFTTRVAQLVDQWTFGPRMYARAARRLLCYHACLCAPFLEWPQCNPEELEASHMLHHSSWRPRAAVCISSQHPTSLQHCNFPLPQGEFKTPVLFSAPNLLKLLLSHTHKSALQLHVGK